MTNVASSDTAIQAESIESTSPVSESAMFAMGGAINFCLTGVAAVGDMMASFSQEPQFQTDHGTTWWLCDGRSAVGTAFATKYGAANIPDMRAVYARGCDNGGSAAGARGLDPNGPQAAGNYIADQVGEHIHSIYDIASSHGANPYGNTTYTGTGPGESFTSPQGFTTANYGLGTETAPKTCYLNWYIKVNV